MSLDMQQQVGENYFQGKTEANMEIVFKILNEIRQDIKDLSNKLTDLDKWKNKVIGMAVVISFVIPLLFEFIKDKLK